MPKSGFKTKFYPNGEFTAGYVPDRGYDLHRPPDDNASRYGELWWFHAPAVRRTLERAIARTPASDLGLSLPANSHRRRGELGITSRGARLVRNAAHVMQERFGRERLSFITLTLPNLPQDELLRCSQEWPRIVRVFCQRLRRALLSRGLPTCMVGCTEIQEERFRERGEVALHLHLLIVGRKRRNWGWEFRPRQFRATWCDVLSTVLEREIWSDAVENVEGIYANASGYLGKYMSKGVAVCSEIEEQGQKDYLPSSWYTCSMNLKRAYKRSIVEVWEDEIDMVAKVPALCSANAVSNIHVASIEFHGQSFMVGISGRIDMSKIKADFIHIHNAFVEVHRRYSDCNYTG